MAKRSTRLRLFGRQTLLDGLCARIERGATRLVLTGGAGIGKSRLAFEIAARVERPVIDVDLSAAEGEADLYALTAAALGVALEEAGGAGSATRLPRAFAALGSVLVVLDNVEQLAASARSAVERWSSAAPSACFLITSRVDLGLGESAHVAIEPLTPAAAAALFVHRARRFVPDFATAGAERAAVSAAIAPLEGRPLALEIASAWIQVYSVAELGEQLHTALLAHLDGRSGRWSSVRAAVAWTWRQLGEEARRIARHAALFRAPFTLEALRGISGMPEAAARLRSLREHGLLREVRRFDGSAPRRFQLFRVVRACCLEGWSPPARAVALDRHAAWFTGSGGGVAEPVLWANAHLGAVPPADLPDLRAAIEHRAALGGPALAETVLRAHRGLFEWGPVAVHRAGLDAALDSVPAASRWARLLLLARGQLNWSRSAADSARDFTRAAERARAAGDRAVEVSALLWLGHGAALAGEVAEARRLLERAGAFGDVDDPLIAAEALHHVAMHHLLCRRFTAAEGALLSGLAHARRADCGGLDFVLSMNLGFLHGERGDFEAALTHRRRALALARMLDSPVNLANALLGVGFLLLQRGRLDEAERVLVEAAARHARLANTRGHGRACGRLGQLHIARGQLDEARRMLLVAESELDDAGELRGAGLARAMRGLTLLLDGVPADAAPLLDEGARRLTAAGERSRGWLLARVATLALHLAGDSDADGVGEADGEADRSAPALPGWLLPAARRIELATLLAAGETGLQGAVAECLSAGDADGAFECRIAQRVLATTVAAVDARRGAGGPRRRLVVAVDGRWFRLDTDAPVDLRRRTHPRQLLAALADLRQRMPGRGLDVETLFAVGWAGDRALARARRQRVHTAIYTLRRAGLGDALERVDGRYRLSPTIGLALERGPPPEAHPVADDD